MDWSQLWLGLGLGIPATFLGYLGYRRSRKVDQISELSGINTGHREGTAQVIEGFKDMVAILQENNKEWRADFKYLEERLDACAAEREALRLEVVRLKRKFGENGPSS